MIQVLLEGRVIADMALNQDLLDVPTAAAATTLTEGREEEARADSIHDRASKIYLLLVIFGIVDSHMNEEKLFLD